MILDYTSADEPIVHFAVFVAVNFGTKPTFRRC